MSDKKITNTSKKSKSMSFNRAMRFEASTLLSWRERGLTNPRKRELIGEYLRFLSDPLQVDWHEFVTAIGVPLRTFQDWVKANDDLKEVHEHVKLTIGTRLQKMARFPKVYDAHSDTINKTLRFYHPDWQRHWDEDAVLKTKEAEKGSSNITVQMERFADCEDVPMKPEVTD